MVGFTFSALDRKYPFRTNLLQKKQNFQSNLEFSTLTNSNMQNSMALFSVSVFNWRYSFWANLVRAIKIVHLRLNLAPRLIQICRTQL